MNEEFWANYCDSACEAAKVGDLHKAEVNWRLAWAQASLLPDDDPRHLMTLEYLADLLCLRENYSEAEPLLNTLLGIKTRLMGEFSVKVAATHNTLAGLYYAVKKLDIAEGHCKRAVAINERIHGPDNSDVAMVLHNLAMVHHAQKRYKEAEVNYLRALEITNRVFGGEHPETVSVAEHYAGLLDAMGRKEESQDCSKTRVLPLLDRLIRTVGQDETQDVQMPTNKGFASATLQGIQRDPRRADQCMYRIKPLPPPEESK